MTTPLSSHGTILSVQETPGGAFTNIAELGDITPMPLDRNEFDATDQARNIDYYVMGVLRRGTLDAPISWIPTDGTHDWLTGVLKLMKDNTLTGWKLTFPDNTLWIASGQMKKFHAKAPVDGRLTADISVRCSGYMQMGPSGSLVTFG